MKTLSSLKFQELAFLLCPQKTGTAGYCHIKEIKYLNNVILIYFLRGIKRKEKKKEVKSKTSKGGCLHHHSKKTVVELGVRTGDRIGSLPFFPVS
jgi:hypothetical protein